jgi:hypothetical protein
MGEPMERSTHVSNLGSGNTGGNPLGIGGAIVFVLMLVIGYLVVELASRTGISIYRATP